MTNDKRVSLSKVFVLEKKEKNRTEKKRNRKEKKRNRFVATFESQKFPKTDRRSSGVNSSSFCNHTHQ
jgi:hypothetical protein